VAGEARKTLGCVPWEMFFVEFAAKFALAPVRRLYLREHWWTP
jgi:hypothetical protein